MLNRGDLSVNSWLCGLTCLHHKCPPALWVKWPDLLYLLWQVGDRASECTQILRRGYLWDVQKLFFKVFVSWVGRLAHLIVNHSIRSNWWNLGKGAIIGRPQLIIPNLRRNLLLVIKLCQPYRLLLLLLLWVDITLIDDTWPVIKLLQHVSRNLRIL